MSRFTYQVVVRPKWADTRNNPARSFARATEVRERALRELAAAGFPVDPTDVGDITDEPMGFILTCDQAAAQELRKMPAVVSVRRVAALEEKEDTPTP